MPSLYQIQAKPSPAFFLAATGTPAPGDPLTFYTGDPFTFYTGDAFTLYS